jgi:leucyl-tRNA---protein transferase
VQQIDFLKTVFDESSVCPYLEGKTARMPLSVPSLDVSPQQFDELLAAGYRRSGRFFYRTQCPACQACEPLRIEVSKFQESRSLRRVLRLGEENLRLHVAEPVFDEQRLKLFNRHRAIRKLDRGESPADEFDYRAFLLEAFCQVWELSFWYENQLVAISITDVGKNSLSAVYCFFDPQFSWLSPGTFAILSQLDLARKHGFKWLYLGMFVADNAHLCYKSRFGPHERLVQGQWQAFQPTMPDKHSPKGKQSDLQLGE